VDSEKKTEESSAQIFIQYERSLILRRRMVKPHKKVNYV